MQQVMLQLGSKQYKSSTYHPESQGSVERFHLSLKNMIRAYCFQYEKEWDQGIHLLQSQRLCHINMLKPYTVRDKTEQVLPRAVLVEEVQAEMGEFSKQDAVMSGSIRLKNSDVLANLGEKLQHLSLSEQSQFAVLILEFVDLFPDVSQRTTLVQHDVDVGDACPIKQHSYRVNPIKLQAMKKEVEYMLAHDNNRTKP